jgi:hypothetical protein
MLLIAPFVGSARGGEPVNPIKINEIRIDQPSTDNDEYFELTGPAAASLNDYTYVVVGDGAVAGGQGVIESVTSLSSQLVPSDGYFLAAKNTITIASPDLTTSFTFENGDNVTHMLVNGFTGSLEQDLDTNDDGVFELTPWSAIADSVAVLVDGLDLTYSATTVGPAAEFQHGHYRVCENTWQIAAVTLGEDDTAGADNNCEDGDDDGVLDADDNCPADFNPGQDDGNTDGEGDVCDAPETVLDSGPGRRTSRGKAVFKFHPDPESNLGTIYECKLVKTSDPLTVIPPKDAICDGLKTVYTGLKNGKYIFEVTASFGPSAVDPTPAVKNFKVRRS